MTTRFRIKKDGMKECKEDHFLANGSKLLEKLVAFANGKCNSIRSFSYDELKTATNNFDPSQVIAADSGYGLYKGVFQDRPISVKKFKDLVDQYEYCFNDIVFASQTSVHKNFLKLLGCCLETQVPIIVFESVANGSLADHIYGPNKPLPQPLLWKQRLKIAIQIANAVAYLHVGFPRPVVFRNIKPLNILLDENYVAKLSDFSIAISIPEGESHVKDALTGAAGLIAPEYLSTGYFNEKHDVFCFGVFMLVLLTGQMAVDYSRGVNGEDQHIVLVDYVKKYAQDNRLKHVIDPIILGEAEQELQSFVEIAFRCISDAPEDRPIMMSVGKELKKMYQSLFSTTSIC